MIVSHRQPHNHNSKAAAPLQHSWLLVTIMLLRLGPVGARRDGTLILGRAAATRGCGGLRRCVTDPQNRPQSPRCILGVVVTRSTLTRSTLTRSKTTCERLHDCSLLRRFLGLFRPKPVVVVVMSAVPLDLSPLLADKNIGAILYGECATALLFYFAACSRPLRSVFSDFGSLTKLLQSQWGSRQCSA